MPHRKLEIKAFLLRLDDENPARKHERVVCVLSVETFPGYDMLLFPSKTLEEEPVNQMQPCRGLISSLTVGGVPRRKLAHAAFTGLVVVHSKASKLYHRRRRT
jgi:hypothetical protein